MRRGLVALRLFAVLAAAGCGGTLDAGRDLPPHNPLLPIDERNPVILINDGWSDNWSGEYSVLLANTGGPPLVGIIVNADKYWRTLSDNTTGWTNMVMAARLSGLTGIPDPTPSAGAQLVKPSDGQIDSTTPNGSAGARLIVDLSRQMSTPLRPIVVLADAPLTDVADAYLVDPTVVERVVIVAALGSYSAPNGVMSAPNGDLDAWASWIVAQRFRFVQVGVWYDQSNDISTSQLPTLPMNPFGQWIANKRPKIFTDITTASDQVSALTSGLPVEFISGAVRAAPDTTGGFDPSKGLPLVPHDGGNIWVVTQTAPPLATSHLWSWLRDPKTFVH